ncbi:hypothetical protein HMPREF0762_01220 [Slackia exigua ATCC 700122]|uniref:Uncharacterized protein n=1 Tax=Slackia exigua (strain ATCC 700122 / DSM 15923 / CIP 105133 / JCM 11022 / KCTC 5966 / S-7) TaxID=649764 RepID=D0WHI1_SLAES|nr:hypothetical protein HMPREF0762_01220 [Slackia exigua ATCC 700122]
MSKQAGYFGYIEILEGLRLELVLKFGDDLGRPLGIQMAEDFGALAGIELLENIRDVGRMKLLEAFMRDGQLDFREVTIEQVHVIPGNDLLFYIYIEEPADTDDGLFQQRMQAAQDPADADLGAEQTQLRAAGRDLQVVHANNFQALRIDDLLIEQIASEKDLSRLKIAEPDVERLGIQDHLVVGVIFDILAPTDHEWRSTRPFECKRCDTRKHLAC